MTHRARASALEALFAHIAATRMDGVPILHPELRVQAVGFEPTADGAAAIGVLITPWFMNLVRLPLQSDDVAAPGDTRERSIGAHRFAFIGAHEPGFGGYESCSLFSPMFEFADHEAALATAQSVLDELRKAPEPPPAPSHSRRALLFGRSAGAAGAAA